MGAISSRPPGSAASASHGLELICLPILLLFEMFDPEVSPKDDNGAKSFDDANRVEHLRAAAPPVMHFSFNGFEVYEVEGKIGCRLFGGLLLRVSQRAAIVLGEIHK
jgi:hypothetical protein